MSNEWKGVDEPPGWSVRTDKDGQHVTHYAVPSVGIITDENGQEHEVTYPGTPDTEATPQAAWSADFGAEAEGEDGGAAAAGGFGY